MAISTISFDKAKIYKNKMFFTIYANNGVYTKILDNNGNNIVNRMSSGATKEKTGDRVIISRKISYEYPDKSIIVMTLKRIYDKAGNLITTQLSKNGF